MPTTYWGVYRVLKNGSRRYVGRTATANRKLAEELAADLSNGIVIQPDGSTRHVTPHPHVAAQIGEGDINASP